METVPCTPYEGQKPGTSGLRKKTRVVMEGTYLANFVQALFNALPPAELQGASLVVGGDGRFYNDTAVQLIVKMAAANGVGRLIVGQGGLLSTPAVSALIREKGAYGGIILTASHNPGGIDEDWGIKFNVASGAPAPGALTDALFAQTKTITEYKICPAIPDVDISVLGETACGESMVVEVVDATEVYVTQMREIFDFDALRRLIARPDFSLTYDALHGVAGPYARRVFVDELGADPACLAHCDPLPDFGGLHADPNLTYASELVRRMGLTSTGVPLAGEDAPSDVPAFGAAADGDADRNMILGSRFFVTPSDSVAVIAANAAVSIPFFSGGLRGVARSMPTSCALDRVAEDLGVPLFEVPTGWKFFGNLMDSAAVYGKEDYTPFLCGEESFGTGSNHVREKDGLWAVLCWLSILAHRNAATPEGELIQVEDVVREHWAKFGRNYYCRYDYEGVESSAADAMMQRLAGMASLSAAAGGQLNLEVGEGYTLSKVDSFSYTDPVDGSLTENQGMRLFFSDGSRVVFRLSGTGSAGATIRMYLEKYDRENTAGLTHEMLGGLVRVALQLSSLQLLTGREGPTVIT